MALNQQQQSALDNAARYIAALGSTLSGAKLYAWWRAAGLKDADLAALIGVIRNERKQTIMADLQAAKREAADAGLTAQEWAAITAPAPAPEE